MATEDIVMNIIIGVFGSFVTLSGIFNWDFFFENRKVKFVVKIAGRNGARIFYSLLGAAMISFTIMAFAGIIDVSK